MSRNSIPAATEVLHRRSDDRNVEGHVLDPRTVVGLDKGVDLARLVVRRDGFVVGELDPRLGVPHHLRDESRTAGAGIDVGGVKVDPPVLFETHHIAQPGHVRLEGQEIRRDVVDDLETVGVCRCRPARWAENPAAGRPAARSTKRKRTSPMGVAMSKER